MDEHEDKEAPAGMQGMDRYFTSVHAGMLDLTNRTAQLENAQRQTRADVDTILQKQTERDKFWQGIKNRLFESALNKLMWFIIGLVIIGALKWLGTSIEFPPVK